MSMVLIGGKYTLTEKNLEVSDGVETKVLRKTVGAAQDDIYIISRKIYATTLYNMSDNLFQWMPMNALLTNPVENMPKGGTKTTVGGFNQKERWKLVKEHKLVGYIRNRVSWLRYRGTTNLTER